MFKNSNSYSSANVQKTVLIILKSFLKGKLQKWSYIVQLLVSLCNLGMLKPESDERTYFYSRQNSRHLVGWGNRPFLVFYTLINHVIDNVIFPRVLSQKINFLNLGS